MEEQVRKAAEAEGESELDGNLGQDRARASEDHIGELGEEVHQADALASIAAASIFDKGEGAELLRAASLHLRLGVLARTEEVAAAGTAAAPAIP